MYSTCSPDTSSTGMKWTTVFSQRTTWLPTSSVRFFFLFYFSDPLRTVKGEFTFSSLFSKVIRSV
jgi:hypothetical protein